MRNNYTNLYDLHNIAALRPNISCLRSMLTARVQISIRSIPASAILGETLIRGCISAQAHRTYSGALSLRFAAFFNRRFSSHRFNTLGFRSCSSVVATLYEGGPMGASYWP